MRVLLPVAFTLSALILVPPPIRSEPPQAAPAVPLKTDVEKAKLIAHLEERIPALMKEADVPGLAIALVRDGELVWHRGFGVKNSKTRDPVDDTTVFEAASLSKPVFAYAVLKLVDAGKFDLDKPLNKYLPGNFDVDDDRLNKITARHVLTHTTGFSNGYTGKTRKMFFAPGERFSYSGDGFEYLWKVIEHVTGEPLDHFVRRMAFEPLGMTRTSFTWLDAYDKSKAGRHNRIGEPTGQGKPPPERAKQGNLFRLHTTAEDYGRFVIATLKGTGLKPETHKLWLTPQVRVREGGASSIDRPEAKPVPDVAWGIGWGLQTTKDGASFWHWGDSGDSKAFVVAFNKPELAVVYFTNSANGLSIAREIVAEAVGGAQPGLDWLDYERYNSPRRALFKLILAKGATVALREYRANDSTRPAADAITENQMNNMGYDLLSLKRVDDALEVFKLNLKLHPDSWNAYDSLAEGYEAAGDKATAIKNFKKSLELNPKNENAVEHLKKLEDKTGTNPPAPAKPPAADPSEGVGAFLRGQMQRLRIPGLQVAVVQDGKIVHLGAYGVANVEHAVPVTNETVFSINSATKSFTGVAIMQLVEDGRVDLAAPVSRYLGGLPREWQAVTVRQLLSLTSGIPGISVEGGDEAAAWAKVQTLPMEFAPGERFGYSQTNYLLLGRIIDKLQGQPFTRFISERQFQAVKMPRTGFGDSADVVPHGAQAYTTLQSIGGQYRRTDTLKRRFDEFPPSLRTAAGINTTAEELARWIIALQQGRLLKTKTSLTTLWAPVALNSGQPSGWALGWPARVRSEHRAVAGIGGMRSAFFVYPDDDLAVVILTNLSGACPEDVIDEVAGHYIPDMRASTGFGLPPAIKAVHIELTKRGFGHAVEVVEDAKKRGAKVELPEADVDAWGYRLLNLGHVKEAVEIFKLNVHLYPKSANTYDSLAEAYETAGDKVSAIAHFKRSLELNPKNNNAIEHLKKLEADSAKSNSP
ncbi:serine hydrolase [Frigoriglobus tundricola]|uniref:Beta-lactamase-related domain-containing protein n=1 Tax=Frigoriglobus tundricola TaxID=2774151 RepID=A0A6M5YWK6_9BACT|nr:serine hydrolase [Frigoriglobus tundricola]QJW97880.1 hypothetical protein FTUN_5460 [Frigoriglobus tundricola]